MHENCPEAERITFQNVGVPKFVGPRSAEQSEYAYIRPCALCQYFLGQKQSNVARAFWLIGEVFFLRNFIRKFAVRLLEYSIVRHVTFE